MGCLFEGVGAVCLLRRWPIAVFFVLVPWFFVAAHRLSLQSLLPTAPEAAAAASAAKTASTVTATETAPAAHSSERVAGAYGRTAGGCRRVVAEGAAPSRGRIA